MVNYSSGKIPGTNLLNRSFRKPEVIYNQNKTSKLQNRLVFYTTSILSKMLHAIQL